MLAKIFPKDPQKQPLYPPNEPILLTPIHPPTHQHPSCFPPPTYKHDPPNHNSHNPHTTAHTSHPHNGGMLSRVSKVSFPHFDGSHLRDWLYKCEQFFTLDNTPQEQRVQLATIHMSGKALTWHHNFMAERYGTYPPWSEYVLALGTRFGTPYDDPLSELVTLTQGADPVDTYLDKFECALTRIHLPPPHALSIFLANLNPSLATHVRQFSTHTVAEAARLAKLHETYLTISQTTTYQTKSPYYKYPSTHQPETTTPQSIKPAFIPRNIAEKQPRKFSYEEMQDRKNRGLCMFCDEKYTPGHQLTHRRSHIYVMEVDDEDPHSSDDDSKIQHQLPIPTDHG